MREAWEVYAEGVAAADAILKATFGVDVRKALNPLNLHDFQTIVRTLAVALKGQVVPIEDAALKQALGKLDAKWTDLGPEARAKVINEAAHYLGPPVVAKVLPKLDQTLAFAQKDIVPATKKNAVLTYDLHISPDLNATDERIANYVRVSQGHFITNKYGERMNAFAGQARGIVAGGLEKGWGSAAIAEELYGELSMHTSRGLPYWNTIAMVYANRARTMTQLASYHEAGIEAYVWESVLDEATSVQCRFLHGQRFPVAHAMQRFQEVEDAESPEAIKTLQPFVSLGRDGERDALVFGSGEDRQVVAHVEEDASGKKDETGSFENAMDGAALQAAGITAPPIHGNCRSTIIPEFGGGGGGSGKPVPAAPPPVPVKPTSGQKKATALAALEDHTLYGKAQFGEGTGIYHESQPPFLNEPFFNQPAEDLAAQWAANAESKKPKIADLIASKSDCDAALVEKYIKNAKALDDAPTPKVVLHNDGLYILSGHEQILAQKLLGQKQAYVDLVNLDHPLVAAPAKEVIAPVAPAIVHDALTDPHASVVWGKTALHEGKVLNGIPIAPAEKGYWETVKDKNVVEPPLPTGTKISAGCVIVEPDGRVWVFEPKDHYGGYEHTFPKGKLEAGLSTQQNALKEVYEEAGLSVNIVGHLGDYKGETGITRYYVAHRTGGAPWEAHFEADKVKLVPIADVGRLLNKDRDKKILADLVKTLGQPKAPLPVISPTPALAPAMASAPSSPVASVVLGTKIGEQAGSNPGGLYRGTDGVQRYVKFYKDPLQAHTEQLANSLYRDLGHVAPKSITFMHEGKLAYASEILKGAKKLGDLELTPALAQKAMHGFVADVLSSNWDAAGLSLDNMVVTPGGDVARIDNGGSFLLRAKGDRKPVSGLNFLNEWEGFFSTKNPSYFKIATAAGYGKAADFRNVILPEIERVVALRNAHGGWSGYVEKIAGGMASADKARVVEMLEARTSELQGRAAELKLLPAWREKKVFPKGAKITAPEGVRIKPPPRDHELLEVTERKDLPDRNVPVGIAATPTGDPLRTYLTKWTLRKIERELDHNAPHALSSIREFSGSYSEKIRAAQCMTKEKFERTYRGSSYEDAVRRGKNIESAFGKVAPQPGQVFRGIGLRGLSDETMNQLMQNDEIGMLGTASCSRQADTAITFMGGLSGSENKVFFVIHQHSAIGIEKHSNHAHEAELLLSDRARLRVLSRHRAAENSNCLIIECEEIEGLVPVPGGGMPDKKPRKPRKPKLMAAVRKVRGELNFDVHTTMPWLLPEGWPTYGTLDGKEVELVKAARTMRSDELSNIVVDVPGVGLVRPWRGQDIAFDEDGVLRI